MEGLSAAFRGHTESTSAGKYLYQIHFCGFAVKNIRDLEIWLRAGIHRRASQYGNSSKLTAARRLEEKGTIRMNGVFLPIEISKWSSKGELDFAIHFVVPVIP